MFQGLRTVIYAVADLEQAKDWYSKVLAQEPYFSEPFYVGFNVAGYELGLQPAEGETTERQTHAAVYWGVESCDEALKQLLAKGATANEDVQDVGGGIKVASVKDPFGNVFGVIENPHFKLP